MKKLKLDLSKFQKEDFLTRDDLRKVLGGSSMGTTDNPDDGKCSVTQKCWNGTISCSGEGSACYFVTSATGQAGVQCDSDSPIYCSVQEVED